MRFKSTLPFSALHQHRTQCDILPLNHPSCLRCVYFVVVHVTRAKESNKQSNYYETKVQRHEIEIVLQGSLQMNILYLTYLTFLFENFFLLWNFIFVLLFLFGAYFWHSNERMTKKKRQRKTLERGRHSLMPTFSMDDTKSLVGWLQNATRD